MWGWVKKAGRTIVSGARGIVRGVQEASCPLGGITLVVRV